MRLPSSEILSDPVFRNPVRLAVLLHLAANGGRDGFGATRRAIGVAAQTLSQQANVLEEAGYVVRDRKIAGGLAHTELILTSPGRDALARYRTAIEATPRVEAGLPMARGVP
jgi:DNA-binding HxlR family transcriptional regulator